MTVPTSRIHYQPDPDNPGWHTWNIVDPSRYNGQVLQPLIVRREQAADGTAMVRLRMQPRQKHANLLDGVHGGVTLGLCDVVLFAAIRILLDLDSSGAVTLDMSTQFLAAGKIGTPLDATAEILRETGRLVFLRGMIEQDGNRIAAFSATVRKASRK